MKFNFIHAGIFRTVNWYHSFALVALLVLLAVGYAKTANNPIDPEMLEHIRRTNPTDTYTLEKNRMQLLFMQERGWVFLLFAALILSFILWINLSNQKRKNRSFIGYKYNLTEKLEKKVKGKLDFQERLRLVHNELTPNDLLFAEMLMDGLSTKEIASQLNISPASANTARYRLRKRMKLPATADLLNELRQI